MLVGFTLSLNAKVLLHIKDPQLRHQYVTSTTNLLYRLTGGDLHSIFRHIYRAKFAIFRHELDSAKRAYLQQYCHRHVETCKERGMAVALCTEDANSLMNRIAQSEFSTTLLRYYDTTAASAGVSPSLPHSTVANATTPTLGWEEAVCWDHVTDERLVEILTSTTAAFRGEEPIQEDFDCGAPELVWSLSGIALLAHCVLNSLLSAELSTGKLYGIFIRFKMTFHCFIFTMCLYYL